MSADMTIAKAFSVLKEHLGVKALEINLMNNKFIEAIVSDRPEKEFAVMIPESKLDNLISETPELRKLSYKTIFHKKFYENIDSDFPFKDLTLKQIGIPYYDIIKVSTEKGEFLVELTGDKNKF